MWQPFLVALSLMLVLEGIWPFLQPTSMRRALLRVAEQDNGTLRLMGLVSMLGGLALLYWVH